MTTILFGAYCDCGCAVWCVRVGLPPKASVDHCRPDETESTRRDLNYIRGINSTKLANIATRMGGEG